jgi:hypothetical protein
MTISDHATSFANRNVETFDPEVGISDPVGTAYLLRVEWDEINVDITKNLELLLQDPQANQLEALVIGPWTQQMYECSSSIVVNALVAAKERLTSLKAVFIGDITYEESEISWINQSDISPLLAAYPNLEVLQVRGGKGLAFSSLSGNLFPKLTYLGLCDSEYSDDIAKAIVQAPIIQRIKVLDLKLGTLSDEGAEALLNCPAVNQLGTLNVAENFLSDETLERLKQLNVEVIADEQKEEEDEEDYGYSRYCSVSE